MRIDVHAHIVPQEIMGTAGEYGPELIETPEGFMAFRVGPYTSRVATDKGLTAESFAKLSDPRGRMAELDRLKVDAMGISVSPLLYLYWAEDKVRLPFVISLNDAMAAYCSADPDRLFVLATLPLPNIEASVSEVARVAEFGARGINIGTNELGNGLNLDSRELWPLYKEIESRGMPLFVHPHPLPMATGADDKYNMSWMVGYMYQETLAVASLLFGGVFDAFPDLKVILPHGGGATPFQFGRLAMARDHQPDMQARKPLREYLPNLYYDILLHDLESRKYLFEWAGADQLVVGSNFGGWDSMNGFELLDELGAGEEEHRKISGGNAAKLFGFES